MGGEHPVGKSLSLHARIRADIEARILSGEWPPGHRVPPEIELMERWNCSRMTVNKAMVALAAQGLVRRNRRAGTIVAHPRIQAAVLSIPDVRAEAEANARSYAFGILCDELRAPCCVHLGAEGHHMGRSRFVRSLHSVDERPVMLEERHIFLDTVPMAEAADFSSDSPSSWLIAHVPWTEAEHRISACDADAETAAWLEAPTGAACLVLERRTRRGQETVTIVRQVFRSDAVDLTARFQPSGHDTLPHQT
ncbi:UTRA domain-containing protein [Pelagibius sp.]|uniref:UTRA domain-containing protein n=1 Tax=Pelagibius sp. TaxID=1931238 RepID=UPI003BB110F8